MTDSNPLFAPKLFTVLKEGYGFAHLRQDALAGTTVAIVALPLSMAIAIACGASPERGLTAAIVGGLLISLLGGSRHQIGGPAGAFIVLVAAALLRHGPEGLALATMLSGLILAGMGLMRLGTFVKYVPFPVTLGFTAAIGIIIAVSQLPDLFGMAASASAHGSVSERLVAVAGHLDAVTPAALFIAALTIATIIGMKRIAPRLPGFLFAIVVATVAATFLPGAETVGERFGRLPSFLPAPRLPPMLPEAILAVLPDALAFALLGAIESLLSAVVADGMTGRRHRANTELIAQGIANIGSALFGGLPVTGTIARTATNVRAGAHGPVSGIIHALVLLIFMAIAAPLAGLIPLAALAGLLLVVAWNMIEIDAIKALVRASRAETVVFLVTLGLTLFRDLTEAIVVGVALSSFVVINRLAALADVKSHDRSEPDA
ncbi:MAG: SulP family inorganic anion transporter, partial [Hyphomicrobiaceae bacterium]|nr:SulP family inorganic anion transporter [Hyphomicrobiaceae bacterium]